MTNDPDQRLMTNDQRPTTNDQRPTTDNRGSLPSSPPPVDDSGAAWRRDARVLADPPRARVAVLRPSLDNVLFAVPNSKFLLPNSDPAGEGEERRVLRVLFQAARDGDLCGVATAGAQLRIGERREQPQIVWTRRGGPLEPVGGGRRVVEAERERRDARGA